MCMKKNIYDMYDYKKIIYIYIYIYMNKRNFYFLYT